MLLPKRVKHRRVMRGKMKGKAMRGTKVSHGEFGLVATTPAWVRSNQIESARIAMTRYIKRGGQVWIKIFPDKPVTEKPAETRMGSGKGSPEYWVSVVKPGRIMFEVKGITEEDARDSGVVAAAYALDKPVISNAKQATAMLKTGTRIKIDIDKGYVYNSDTSGLE